MQLEAAWLLATGRQEPPELACPAHLPDIAAVRYADAARRLSVSERTIERLVRSGDLPTVAIGGSPRIRVTDLTAYVERRPIRPAVRGVDSSAEAASLGRRTRR
jgi:excisionase family DNA binding protein